MSGINLGGRTLYAIDGVVAEAHGQHHFKVSMEQVSNVVEGRVIGGSLILVNSQTVFDAIKNAGIVFSGPAPFDSEGRCMRFMFEKDARALYEAFRRAE